ncbi:MAG: PRC-barrel domain-containing protein [Paracoccaceae bacterium]|uniref:PRC-barrel domain-containing protein n=1 Tax=Seohaeicola saemankumensis TaxID=481181 RepID=UPI001E4616F4|nr:PRC-barrel domain-containing protein [Seohaeicola saemankumensis]MCD1625414.1 PRC-barrel domain-containing protein [Seohaeicola saemankumensis]
MTIKTLMTTSALSLLLATSAIAQTDSTTAPADNTAPMAGDSATDTMAPQSLSEMTVGDLNGTDVMDANGDSIGNITDVVQGTNDGEAVVGIGGFLGIGQYDVALPLSDLSYNAADQVISVSLTREELEAMPEYDGTDREPLPADTQLSTLMDDTPDVAVPATDAPATDAPATEAPEADAPEADAPEADEPATEEPETDAPTTDDAPASDTSGSDTMESDTDTEEERPAND